MKEKSHQIRVSFGTTHRLGVLKNGANENCKQFSSRQLPAPHPGTLSTPAFVPC